jgi:hypothetical protein
MSKKGFLRSLLSLLIAATFVFAPCTTAFTPIFVAEAASISQELDKGKWAPGTREALNKLIKANAGKKGAYAVFDWDNTCVYPDTEENMFVYMMDNLSFKMSPEEFRYAFTHYTDTGKDENIPIPKDNFVAPYTSIEGTPINIDAITEDVVSDYTFFYNNYRGMNSKATGNMTLEEIQQTDQFKDFKAKMWFAYSALYDSFAINVSYTWIMFVMFPGMTSAEARDLAVKASDWGLARENKKVYFDSPASLPGKAGAVSNTAAGNYFRNAMRLHSEMGNLIEDLELNKIPVYVSTASLQDIIDAVATNPKYGYNLPANRVMGMRLKKDANGKFIAQYDTSNNYTINSVDGKTVNINNILVKQYGTNPVMIAGDSDGDYYMMTELSGLNGMKMANTKKPVQLILIINRLKGNNIGALSKIAAAQLSGTPAGKTVVVLQGRDENTGMFVPSEKTVKLGKAYGSMALLP